MSENRNNARSSNSGGGRGRDRGRRRRRRSNQQTTSNKQPQSSKNGCPKKILVLHGSRQTGQLLLGRMDKLNKTLQKEYNNNLQLIAPDGPFDHPDEANLRQWWDRHDNEYRGLETSLCMLQDLWESEQGDDNGDSMVGILGFSQGARLAHLISLCQEHAKAQKLSKIPFQGLQFVILVAGYDAPIPDNFTNALQSCSPDINTESDWSEIQINIPSLHIWGNKDALVLPEQSRAVMKFYENPTSHEHDGGHHVPMKATSISAYIDFVKPFAKIPGEDEASGKTPVPPTHNPLASAPPATKPQQQPPKPKEIIQPDEETAQAQQDEVEALTAIFPEEVTMVSKVTMNENTGENVYKHPISYRIALHPEDDGDAGANTSGHWPPRPLSLYVTYPHNYPSDDASPEIKLVHDNNVMQWPSAKAAACLNAIQEAAEAERGMPCVLSCVYVAREFLDSGADIPELANNNEENVQEVNPAVEIDDSQVPTADGPGSSLLKQASKERIQQCNMEGLAIAEELLGRAPQSVSNVVADGAPPLLSGKGGSWLYTIGLVGKPSAGKSTFFNTASAFARQRDDADNVLGGATMAPHPFTTIDPNIGFCLVPAPEGSCPEEDLDESASKALDIGSSHGRDSLGRRLLPVLLKDVAGLVPGAYQGRGRGNKFLNDLTDADVLVHVVDSSGKADSEGNVIGNDDDDDEECNPRQGDLMPSSQPLNDLAWIRNELIEWVFTNLMFKWDSVLRKGRTKLWDMFSGYGQTQAVVTDVLLALEKHIEKMEQREKALDHIDEWDTGDVHRLVSAFLGVRFPMALALNKYDMPSSVKHVEAIQEALPIHGAHVAVPLSARSEMNFIRYHLLQSAELKAEEDIKTENEERRVPLGTWHCLQSAMSLREPVLVFPVSDMATYKPLAGMLKYATGDPSLPSAKMISCLQAAGGSIPTLWDTSQCIYTSNSGGGTNRRGPHDKNQQHSILRDVVIMKPGSTVEDVFNSLKRLGALGGEFVRAEGAGAIGEKPKLVPKSALVSKSCRILKIMTTKRTQWQQQHAAAQAK